MIASLLMAVAQQQSYSWRETLDAIRVVETGGSPNLGLGATGDRGKSIGPFQVSQLYYLDASSRDRSLLRNHYRRCLTSTTYSERVVQAYMIRYARPAFERLKRSLGTLGDVEQVARLHSGGPRGPSKKASLRYWLRVRSQLELQHQTRRDLFSMDTVGAALPSRGTKQLVCFMCLANSRSQPATVEVVGDGAFTFVCAPCMKTIEAVRRQRDGAELHLLKGDKR